MHSQPATHDLVLVGAGHTNMHVVRMFRMNPIPGVRLTLISAFGRAPYSGMLPGTLAGLYDAEDMSVDLYRAVEPSGMQLIVAEATGLDPARRRVFLRDRPPVRFDVCAVGIGSTPAQRDLWQDQANVLSIKPMATFLPRLNEQLDRLGDSSEPNLTVVGGGAAGTEVAFCVENYLRTRKLKASVTLVDSGDHILSGYLEKTRSLAMVEMQRRGIRVESGRRVTQVADGKIGFEDGTELTADIVIWAAAAAAPPVLEQFQLPKTDDGFLAVAPTLQTTSGDPVFVVGDTASFVDRPLPKAGVYAVRQGPVLWENIRRRMNNQSLIDYAPQSGFMSLLATGDGRAIGQYKGRALHNRWVWKLKDYIDRKFMRMHQAYEPMVASPPPAVADDVPAMKCRGCGGKVGAGVLSAALERLKVGGQHEIGLAEPDDAAILDLTDGPANIVSVDFFSAFLSDPYLVGRVAALNSLSDLWAMGADAVGALAMVTLPEARPGLQTETLYQLLAGGVHELNLAGAELLGGHTIESAEMTVGYTVLGRLPDGATPFRKNGVRPGDSLVLTKPLGSGTLLAGVGECRCTAEWMAALLQHMLVSNQAASKVARAHGVVAATDVTGFGLAGHAAEMLTPSQCTARITSDRLPVYEGFRELTEQGVRSTLYPANRESAEMSGVRLPANEDPVLHALFDPQTSGGMLMAVPSSTADDLVASLRENGYPEATVIGHATAEDSDARLVLE